MYPCWGKSPWKSWSPGRARRMIKGLKNAGGGENWKNWGCLFWKIKHQREKSQLVFKYVKKLLQMRSGRKKNLFSITSLGRTRNLDLKLQPQIVHTYVTLLFCLMNFHQLTSELVNQAMIILLHGGIIPVSLIQDWAFSGAQALVFSLPEHLTVSDLLCQNQKSLLSTTVRISVDS